MTHARFISIALLLAMMVAPDLARASTPSVDAAHQIVVEPGHLRVTSRWYGHLPRDGWEFAAPLPPDTRARGRGATLILDPDDRSVVGITVDNPLYPLTFELEIPWAAGDPILALPLPPEPGWQRLEIEGDYRLIPDPGAGLTLHTGYYGPGDLRVHERLRIDRQLDRRHPAGAAYLPGAALIEAGGVPAQLESGARRRLGLGIAAGGAFVCGLFTLTVVFRRSAAAVEVEDAQAYLDSEFRTLCGDDSSEQS